VGRDSEGMNEETEGKRRGWGEQNSNRKRKEMMGTTGMAGGSRWQEGYGLQLRHEMWEGYGSQLRNEMWEGYGL
jgi:hypothetical protein